MYYDFIQTHKRRLLVIIGFLFAFIVVWSIWTYIDRYGKVALVVSTVPRDIVVQIGDKKLGHGTHYLPAGQYQVEATNDGFEPQKRLITVTEKKDQNVLAISLAPQSQYAKKWADEHAHEYKKNEEFGAIEASSNGRYFSELHPITKQLPFIDPYYKISYTAKEDNSIHLTISTPSPRYRYYAIAKLRSMGYDPVDFVIQFKDYHNPLEQP